jgi:adenylyltransferase/sulfurtransferase
LLLVDALEMKFRELKLRKNPECPICGPHRTIHKLIDYNQFCGIGPEAPPPPGMSEFEIDPVEVKKKIDRGDNFFLLDVREPHEVDICQIPGSHLIPVGQVPSRANELNSADDIIVYCRSGQRSGKAVDFLRKAGFKKVKNMVGGILAWSDMVDPSVPKY